MLRYNVSNCVVASSGTRDFEIEFNRGATGRVEGVISSFWGRMFLGGIIKEIDSAREVSGLMSGMRKFLQRNSVESI